MAGHLAHDLTAKKRKDTKSQSRKDFQIANRHNQCIVKTIDTSTGSQYR